MLVLTRKADEQILIGDDIKITLVRVRGNSIRLGIDAPRDVRIVRGELDALPAAAESDIGSEIDDHGEVFAHPQASLDSPSVSAEPHHRVADLIDSSHEPAASPSRSIFVGRIRRPETNNRLKGAPLAGFVTPR